MTAESLAPAPAAGEQVLQSGYGRRVVHEAVQGTVRKTFWAGRLPDRRRAAEAELARLTAFEAVLAAVPGATCPRPLGTIEEPAPGYRMSFVPGEDLLLHLARHRVPAATLAAWGRTIAAALRAYVDAVGEPYHDLKLGNIILEPSGSLSFLDFGLPQDHIPSEWDELPVEMSLANLLAGVVFESGRPMWLLNRRLHRQSAAVAATVADQLDTTGEGLRRDVLQAAYRLVYRRLTYLRGSPARTAWYGTVGWLVARRLRLPVGRFGPVPPHAR